MQHHNQVFILLPNTPLTDPTGVLNTVSNDWYLSIDGGGGLEITWALGKDLGDRVYILMIFSRDVVYSREVTWQRHEFMKGQVYVHTMSSTTTINGSHTNCCGFGAIKKEGPCLGASSHGHSHGR